MGIKYLGKDTLKVISGQVDDRFEQRLTVAELDVAGISQAP